MFQKSIQPFLIEISKILIERVFVTISLNKTGPLMFLKIQMFCGLSGKRNFWISLIFMRHFELDELEPIKHLNSQLKKGMHDRDAANRKAITSHNPRGWDKYKKLRNKINNNIKTSKASY